MTMNIRRTRRSTVLGAALLAALALLAATAGAWAQDADEDVRVTNHSFAERVIQTAEGGYILQDVIVGFERGTHSFETLTQIVLPRGRHTIEMAIFDPDETEVVRIKFDELEATRDGWTQSLRGLWRDVRFRRAGLHTFVVFRNGKPVARFFLTVA